MVRGFLFVGLVQRRRFFVQHDGGRDLGEQFYLGLLFDFYVCAGILCAQWVGKETVVVYTQTFLELSAYQ